MGRMVLPPKRVIGVQSVSGDPPVMVGLGIGFVPHVAVMAKTKGVLGIPARRPRKSREEMATLGAESTSAEHAAIIVPVSDKPRERLV